MCIALAVLAIGCTSEYIQQINPVCFERDVLPIFQSNCTQSGCHNTQDRTKGFDYSTYEGISKAVIPGDYRNSKTYQVLILTSGGEAMPPQPYNRLTDAQITTIASWIEEGANKTTCSDQGNCDVTNPSYSGTVKPILDTYCSGCHSGSSPQGNVDYNQYNGVKATVTNGRLLGAIDHASGFSAMPKNSNKLSACNILKIRAWIDAGALNN